MHKAKLIEAIIPLKLSGTVPKDLFLRIQINFMDNEVQTLELHATTERLKTQMSSSDNSSTSTFALEKKGKAKIS